MTVRPIAAARWQLAADIVGLSDEQRRVVLNSGEPTYANRIERAPSQVARIGALARPSRVSYHITDAGRQVLAQFPHGITQNQLDALGQDPTWAITPYVPTKKPERPRAIEPTVLDPSAQCLSAQLTAEAPLVRRKQRFRHYECPRPRRAHCSLQSGSGEAQR